MYPDPFCGAKGFEHPIGLSNTYISHSQTGSKAEIQQVLVTPPTIKGWYSKQHASRADTRTALLLGSCFLYVLEGKVSHVTLIQGTENK